MADNLPPLPEPDAQLAVWHADESIGDGGWTQWHDRSDPLPATWDGMPPDAVVNHYAQATMTAYALAARQADEALLRELEQALSRAADALARAHFELQDAGPGAINCQDECAEAEGNARATLSKLKERLQ